MSACRPCTGASASDARTATTRAPTAPATARGARTRPPFNTSIVAKGPQSSKGDFRQGTGNVPPAAHEPRISRLSPLDEAAVATACTGAAANLQRHRTAESRSGCMHDTARKPYIAFSPESGSAGVHEERLQSPAELNRRLIEEFFATSAPIEGKPAPQSDGAAILPHTLQALMSSSTPRGFTAAAWRTRPSQPQSASKRKVCVLPHPSASGNGTADHELVEHFLSLRSNQCGTVASTFFMDAVVDAAQTRTAAPRVSKIPMRHWILRDGPVADLGLSEDDVRVAYESDSHLLKRLVFPSISPGNRPEAFFLAQALDRMCAENEDFDALFDVDAAFSVDGEEGFVKASERYADAGGWLLRVLDCALSEVARQVAPSCIERAALLDRVRHITTDFVSTCLDVVRHCRDVAGAALLARDDAVRQQTEWQRKCEELDAVVDHMKSKHGSLEDELKAQVGAAEALRDRVARYELLASVGAHSTEKQQTFHALGESAAAMAASTVLSSSPKSAPASPSTTEAGVHEKESTPGEGGDPSVEESQDAQRESPQKRAEDYALYEQALSFLHSLNEAVDATDSACRPFFDGMVFNRPSLSAPIARNKWVAIAKAVGQHEALVAQRELMLRRINSRKSLAQRNSTSAHTEAHMSPHEAALLHRQVGEAGSDEAFVNPPLIMPPRFGVTPADIVNMLRETKITMDEISARLVALSASELVRRLAAPPAMPPVNPAEPCSLCGRVDVVGADRKRRNDVVARANTVAREEAARLEARIEKQIAEIESLRKQLSKHQKLQKDYETQLVALQLSATRPCAPELETAPAPPHGPTGTGTAASRLATAMAVTPTAAPVSVSATAVRDIPIIDVTHHEGGDADKKDEQQRRQQQAEQEELESTPRLEASLSPPPPRDDTGSVPRFPRRATALPNESRSSPSPIAMRLPVCSSVDCELPAAAPPQRSRSPPLVLNLVINCSCSSKPRPPVVRISRKAAASNDFPTPSRSSALLSTSCAASPTATATCTAVKVPSKAQRTSAATSATSPSEEASISIETPLGSLPNLAFDVDAPLRESNVSNETDHDQTDVDNRSRPSSAGVPDCFWRRLCAHAARIYGVTSLDGASGHAEAAALASTVDNEQAAIVQQLEAAIRASGVQVSNTATVKPLGWVLRLISGFYSAKMDEDLVRTFDRKPIRTSHEFLFVHLRQHYGTQKLVDEAVVHLAGALRRHLVVESRTPDPRIVLFARFLSGFYDERALNFALRLDRVCREAAVGPEYDTSTAAADDQPHAASRICFMRLLFLVDAVLVGRPYRGALLRACWQGSSAVDSHEVYRDAMLRGVHHSTRTPVALVPKGWSPGQIAMSRAVLPRATFVAIATHLEAAHLSAINDESGT